MSHLGLYSSRSPLYLGIWFIVRPTKPGTTLSQTPRGYIKLELADIPPFLVESLVLVVLDRTPHILSFQMVELWELSLVHRISRSKT